MRGEALDMGYELTRLFSTVSSKEVAGQSEACRPPVKTARDGFSAVRELSTTLGILS